MTKLMVTKVACNIRQQASMESAILGALKSKVEVAVDYRVGDWWELPLSWGYIHADLLGDKIVPPITPTPNPPPPLPPLGTWYKNLQAKRGVGVTAGGWSPDAAQLALFKRNGVNTAFICAYEKGQAKTTIKTLKANGATNFIFRACWRGGMEFFAEESADVLAEYYAEMESAYGKGNFPFIIQVHNEPNLNTEGYLQPNGGWKDGYAFSEFYRKCALEYKSRFTNAKIGFPALSPGNAIVSGNVLRRAETQFAAECGLVIKDTTLTDWVGVHYYWQDKQGADINPPIAFWNKTYYNRPLIATEVAPVDAMTTSITAVKTAYQRFEQVGIPNIAYILSGSGGWLNSDWQKNGIAF